MKLMVMILLMLLPVTIVLIIWSAIGNIRLDYSNAVQDSKVTLLLYKINSSANSVHRRLECMTS